jgi:single-stranded DNA-binding protein
MRLQFSGEARKVEHKTIGGKSAVEIQLCKKNYTPHGQEATFTWVRVTVFEPKEFQKFHDGGFVSGSGELSMRSYTDKDGNKKQSLEVRCTSFDVETPRGVEAQEAPAPAPRRPAPATPADDTSAPPF